MAESNMRTQLGNAARVCNFWSFAQSRGQCRRDYRINVVCPNSSQTLRDSSVCVCVFAGQPGRLSDGG